MAHGFFSSPPTSPEKIPFDQAWQALRHAGLALFRFDFFDDFYLGHSVRAPGHQARGISCITWLDHTGPLGHVPFRPGSSSLPGVRQLGWRSYLCLGAITAWKPKPGAPRPISERRGALQEDHQQSASRPQAMPAVPRSPALPDIPRRSDIRNDMNSLQRRKQQRVAASRHMSRPKTLRSCAKNVSLRACLRHLPTLLSRLASNAPRLASNCAGS